GITGFILFALVHWLCDFIWCYFLSTASYKGGRFLGKTFQRIVFSVCGVFLLFFSGKFILEGVRIFFT
ncbi:MAG: LysE family transporter, partial [Spirochaetes bacterium]|nr:LysE family transporter [Spirochaetota bacterium]